MRARHLGHVVTAALSVAVVVLGIVAPGLANLLLVLLLAGVVHHVLRVRPPVTVPGRSSIPGSTVRTRAPYVSGRDNASTG